MKFQRLLRSTCDCRRGARILLAVTLPRYLKDHFQLDRGAERKACDSIHQATRTLVLSEDVSQQLRSSVRDFRLFADISRSGHRHAEANDALDSVERSQMLPRDSEDVERCEVSRLAASFHIEFRTDAPNEFRAVAFGGKHAAQKKQIARLHRFHVGTEWLRGRGELDAQFFQPLLGAGRPGFSAHYKCSALRVCTHVYLLLQMPPEMRPEWRRLNCNDLDSSGYATAPGSPAPASKQNPKCYEAIRPKTRGLNNRTLISIIL